MEIFLPSMSSISLSIGDLDGKVEKTETAF